MALTVALLGAATFNTTAGNKTVVATPTLGDMIVVVCAGSGVTTISLTDNNADGHGTYETIVSVLKNASADQMVAFVRSDPVRSGTSTTWTSVQTSSTGGGLAVFRVAGAALCGPAFIRQSGSQANHASGVAPATPLATGVALTGNALIAAVFDAAAPPGLTVPTGWAAADVNTSYTVPQNGLEITHINSGFIGSTVTWNTSDATAFSSLAFEMKADAAGHMGDEDQVRGDPFSIQTIGVALTRAAFYMTGWNRRATGLLVPKPGVALAG